MDPKDDLISEMDRLRNRSMSHNITMDEISQKLGFVPKLK
jgi:hypothetical protein